MKKNSIVNQIKEVVTLSKTGPFIVNQVDSNLFTVKTMCAILFGFHALFYIFNAIIFSNARIFDQLGVEYNVVNAVYAVILIVAFILFRFIEKKSARVKDIFFMAFTILITFLEARMLFYELRLNESVYRFAIFSLIISFTYAHTFKSFILYYLVYAGAIIESLIFNRNLSEESLIVLLMLTITLVISCLSAFVSMINSYSKFTIRRTLEAKNEQLLFYNERLETQSYTDPLTKIANRRAFVEYLSQKWSECRREDKTLTVIMMDIDFFKKYNDHYGHYFGDQCLIKVSACVRKFFNRANEMFARYGGEEFIVIIPNITGEQALDYAEKIRASIIGLEIDAPPGLENKYVTISLGVAHRRPSEVNEYSDLIKLADKALYKAKESGRNRVFGDISGKHNSAENSGDVISIARSSTDINELERLKGLIDTMISDLGGVKNE